MSEPQIDARRSAAALSQSAFRLVLGSQSPRRRQLLTQDGYHFAILPAKKEVEEEVARLDAALSPDEYARELSIAKARDVARQLCGKVSQGRWQVAPYFKPSLSGAPYLVLACDSIAVCDGAILGKPEDRADAERMLRTLSGSRHEVITGMALQRVEIVDYESGPNDARLETRVEVSELLMDELEEEQLRYYLDSELWKGKAGAFGYQDGNDWLKLVSGSESNVVGLPLEALALEITKRFHKS
ncbi:MAG: Maf family protein [Thermoguttaceae bacterium]